MNTHYALLGARPIIGLVARGDITKPKPEEPLFEPDNTPIPERLREAAAKLSALPLVCVRLPHEGETFSARAWEIIRRIEAGVRRSNVVETYRGLIPGLPERASDNPGTPGGHALRRFRDMVMAHGFVFRDHFGRETIAHRPLPRLQHDL